MKYAASSILLAVAALAAPTPGAKNDGVEARAPVVEAFAKEFRTFIGRSEEDVDKFIARGEKITDETKETALTWKRNAEEAAEEASHAIAVAKRSLHIRRETNADANFWIREMESADLHAKRATNLRKEAEEATQKAAEARDEFTAAVKRSIENPASNSQDEIAAFKRAAEEAEKQAAKVDRDADSALSESAEAYAIVAYTLKIRDSNEDVEAAVARDETAAEMAMAKERQAKREVFFANKAAKKREAIHEQTLKLRESYAA